MNPPTWGTVNHIVSGCSTCILCPIASREANNDGVGKDNGPGLWVFEDKDVTKGPFHIGI